MTTITHTPDGPRFDGMSIEQLIEHLRPHKYPPIEIPAVYAIIDALHHLRHLSEWQPIETAPPDVDLLLGWMETFGHRRWVQAVAYAKHSNTCHPDSGASNAWSHGQATHWRPLPPGPMEGTP